MASYFIIFLIIWLVQILQITSNTIITTTAPKSVGTIPPLVSNIADNRPK